MKILIKFSFLLFIICSCSVLSKRTTPDEYKKKLDQIINYIIQGKNINTEQIQTAIPKTEGDFSTFYSYTERDGESNVAFYKLNNLILEHAINKERNVFKSFLLLSEYVDGEYAESYFEDVEALIEKNKELFCELYNELP